MFKTTRGNYYFTVDEYRDNGETVSVYTVSELIGSYSARITTRKGYYNAETSFEIIHHFPDAETRFEWEMRETINAHYTLAQGAKQLAKMARNCECEIGFDLAREFHALDKHMKNNTPNYYNRH